MEIIFVISYCVTNKLIIVLTVFITTNIDCPIENNFCEKSLPCRKSGFFYIEYRSHFHICTIRCCENAKKYYSY